jgi:hypothetical protein
VHRVALLLALVGALHGIVYAPLVSDNVAPDTPSYRAAAEALLDGSYTTPVHAGFYYELRTRSLVDVTGEPVPRAAWSAPERQIFRPPGYPSLLALAGGGRSEASQWVALVLQALLFGAGVFLLVETVALWWSPKLALASGALYALDPYSKHYVALLLSEALAATLLLACVYGFTRAWRGRAVRWWAVAGAAAGALTLTRVVFVLVPVLLVVAALVAPGRRWHAAGAAAASAAALLVPWVVWTWSVAERPLLASYGQGYNLLLAAHGEGLDKTQTEVLADPAFVRDVEAAHETAPGASALLTDPTAHPRYVARADREMRERALQEYGDRLSAEPLQVAWETVYRAFFLWNAHEDWYQPDGLALLALRVIDWLFLVAAVVGAGIALARGPAAPARALVVFALVYTIAMATHHVEARFAMPLRGFYFAFAALAAAAVIAKAQSQNAAVAELPAASTKD